MSRLIYWSATIPQVVNSLFREIKAASAHTALCLQISPEEKTVHVSDVRPDEIIRAQNTDFSALKKWVSLTRDNNTTLIIDFWGLLNSHHFERLLKELADICLIVQNVVLLCPELHTGYWKNDAIFTHSDSTTRKIFESYFQRVQALYDFCLNLKTKNSIVASTPTLRCLELMTGRPKLGPQRYLGLAWLPDDCKQREAQFTSSQTLVKAILLQLSPILKKEETSLYWAKSAERAIKYRNGQAAEGATQLSKSGFVLPTPWSRFVRNDKNTLGLHPEFREIQVGIGKRWQVAKWFYFLSVMEGLSLVMESSKSDDVFF